MTPRENAEDPLVVLYLRRYHMNPKVTTPSNTRTVTVLMTDLATTPTCNFFVVSNWMSLTGILRMVSQPWKKALSTQYGLLEQRRKHCALCCADKEMTTIFSMSCGDPEIAHLPIKEMFEPTQSTVQKAKPLRGTATVPWRPYNDARS